MTLSYDFSDAAEGGDFVVVPPGRTVFKFVGVDASEKSAAGNPKAIVRLEVVAHAREEFVGGLISQHWNTTGKASFRFRDFLTAIGYKAKTKGKLDLRKYYGKTIGAIVSITLGEDEETEFNNLSRIVPGKTMLALMDEDEPEKDDYDEDEDEEESDGTQKDTSSEEGDDESQDGDEESFSAEDVADMELAELKEICEEYDVSVKPVSGKTRVSASQLRKRILAELFEDDGEDDDEEPF